MTDYRNAYSQINTITEKLIAIGLSVRQNFASCKPLGRDSYEIGYTGMRDLCRYNSKKYIASTCQI